MTGLVDAFESGEFPNLGRLCIDFYPNSPVEGRSRYRMLETNGNKWSLNKKVEHCDSSSLTPTVISRNIGGFPPPPGNFLGPSQQQQQ